MVPLESRVAADAATRSTSHRPADSGARRDRTRSGIPPRSLSEHCSAPPASLGGRLLDEEDDEGPRPVDPLHPVQLSMSLVALGPLIHVCGERAAIEDVRDRHGLRNVGDHLVRPDHAEVDIGDETAPGGPGPGRGRGRSCRFRRSPTRAGDDSTDLVELGMAEHGVVGGPRPPWPGRPPSPAARPQGRRPSPRCARGRSRTVRDATVVAVHRSTTAR